MEQQLREHLRRHQAKEIIRKRQHGYGRPVISAVLHGRRLVLVGNRSRPVSADMTFHEFLIDNMKDVLGRQWGADAIKAGSTHRLFRWLKILSDAIDEARLRQKNIEFNGSISALFRFAYGLYLIEHNDKPPVSLLTRLRNDVGFAPAVYETIVAGAFAVAGARIDGAEDTKASNTKPEFRATFASGRRYEIEAKRKESWRSAFDLRTADTQTELAKWIRGKLHDCAKKRLQNPVYWLELSIPTLVTRDDFALLDRMVRDAVARSEDLTIQGQPVGPAYVFVTSNCDLANETVREAPWFATLLGFAMSDFRDGEVEIEEALDQHDRHRDMHRVLQCLTEVERVPASFDGVPSELLTDAGQVIRPPQIGDKIYYPTADGTTSVGKIEALSSRLQGDAMLIVRDETTGTRAIAKMPLSPAEAAAAAKFGNAIFGKPEGPQRDLGGDLFAIYDRMLEIHSDSPHDALLRMLANNPELPAFSRLSLQDLRKRVAREMAKSLYLDTKDR